jgi:hypothetical protein
MDFISLHHVDESNRANRIYIDPDKITGMYTKRLQYSIEFCFYSNNSRHMQKYVTTIILDNGLTVDVIENVDKINAMLEYIQKLETEGI